MEPPQRRRALPPQVPLLTAPQIEQFKAEGFLILPACLDLQHCEAVCDSMWGTVAEQLPRMQRGDPSTWHVTEEEAQHFAKPAGELDPYFSAGMAGHGGSFILPPPPPQCQLAMKRSTK